MCNSAVQDPAKYVPALEAAGASSITFQIEPFLNAAAAAAAGGQQGPAGTAGAVKTASELAADIRRRGMRAAVALAVGTGQLGVEAAVQLVEQGAVDMVSGAWA